MGRLAEEAVTDRVAAAFVRKVDERVMDQIPTLAADPMLTEVLHGSTGSQWRSFVTNLTSEHRFAPTAAAIAAVLIDNAIPTTAGDERRREEASR